MRAIRWTSMLLVDSLMNHVCFDFVQTVPPRFESHAGHPLELDALLMDEVIHRICLHVLVRLA